MTSTTPKPGKVITPEAILSYPHLAEPQAPRDGVGKAKYSCTLVFAPGSDLRALEAAALAAAETKWPGKGAHYLERGLVRSPFRRDGELKGYEAGSTFINVRTEKAPGVVSAFAGEDGKPTIIAQSDIAAELYPGAIVRASVAAFAYDSNGNKGVSFALNNIQKLRDGTRIDGRLAATDEFLADLSAAPSDLEALLG